LDVWAILLICAGGLALLGNKGAFQVVCRGPVVHTKDIFQWRIFLMDLQVGKTLVFHHTIHCPVKEHVIQSMNLFGNITCWSAGICNNDRGLLFGCSVF
jgi:hypothetical protein